MKPVIIFIRVLSTLSLIGTNSVVIEGIRVKRFAIRGPKWDHTDLTWNLVNTLPKLGNKSQIKNALITAMGYWTKHSVLTFTEKKSNDADIQISFQSGKHNDIEPFNGPGLILAHAFYPGKGIGGDIHIDADEDWNLKSFIGVVVHELGHSLGLSHSSDEEASMYAWYRGGKTDITQDDINGIKTIYPYPVKKQVLNTMQTLKKPLTFYPTLIEYIPKNLSPPPPPPSTAATITTIATKMLHQLPQMSATNPSKPFVDKCKMAYDAVAVLRGELFIFKDKYFWRLGRDERVDKQLYNTNSFRIRSIWSSLPENLEKIDSVYQNKNGEIVFFINLSIYVFNENILVKIAPLKDISRVDGIFIWHEKTYIFSGSYFWLFDESTLRVDKQFTRKIKHIWKGVPSSGIDSVFQYTNGKTYFFKGLFYWEFNDRTMAVVGKPMLSSQQWMRCSQVLVLPRMQEQQQQHHRHQHQRHHHHHQQQSIHKKRLLQLREMQRHKQVQQQQKMQRHKQIRQRQQIHRQQQIQQKRKQKYYLQLNGQQQWKQQQQQPKQQQQLLQWQQRQSMYTKPIKNRAFAPSTVNKHSTCLQNGYSKFLTTNICRQQLQPNYIRQFQQR